MKSQSNGHSYFRFEKIVTEDLDISGESLLKDCDQEWRKGIFKILVYDI